MQIHCTLVHCVVPSWQGCGWSKRPVQVKRMRLYSLRSTVLITLGLVAGQMLSGRCCSCTSVTVDPADSWFRLQDGRRDCWSRPLSEWIKREPLKGVSGGQSEVKHRTQEPLVTSRYFGGLPGAATTEATTRALHQKKQICLSWGRHRLQKSMLDLMDVESLSLQNTITCRCDLCTHFLPRLGNCDNEYIGCHSETCVSHRTHFWVDLSFYFLLTFLFELKNDKYVCSALCLRRLDFPRQMNLLHI